MGYTKREQLKREMPADEFELLFGDVRLEGFDAGRMFTPFRWLRYKLTGDPLRRREREHLNSTVYPQLATTYRFDRMLPTRVNLVSLDLKYTTDEGAPDDSTDPDD